MSRLPISGIACWPVGNGDAITLVAPDGLILQFDINHSSSEDNDWAPVVDLMAQELQEIEHDGTMKPELPVLLISHHDEDHIRGITRVFDEWRVNELIITLRCFVEGDELTDLGEELLAEAKRRRDEEVRAAAAGKRAARGDRLQIVGYADVLKTEGWQEFPEELLTVPGHEINLLDGEDHSSNIELFVQSPFRDDTESGERNDSCLGLHVTMKDSGIEKKYLLLGDLEHSTIEAIFEISIASGNEDRLEWDVLIAPHHCSRHAVRTQSADEWEDWIDAPAADYLGQHNRPDAVVLVSSDGNYTPASTKGANPPHSDARAVYEGIVGKSSLYNTHDEAKGEDSYPVSIGMDGKNKPTPEERAKRLSATATSLGVNLRSGDPHIKGVDRKFA